jgi:excinuclease ABC subunit A
MDRFREHTIEILVGVLDWRMSRGSRTAAPGNKRDAAEGAGKVTPQQLIDEALKLGGGTLLALDNHGKTTVHSIENACPKCGRSFEKLDPKNFSYNSPAGWCPKCRGFGELFYMPEDVDRGAREDAISESWFDWMEGKREPCPMCNGARLNPVARSVHLPLPHFKVQIPGIDANVFHSPGGPAIDVFSAMPVGAALQFFNRLRFSGRAAAITRDILPEIRERLKFLDRVGLGYLQLGRGVPTLSGGEGQRIRLAAQLGSTLSGVLYILDEPTIGLHARDNERLLESLESLKARGNSVLVVEHDEATMRRADHVIDLGPGAGIHGGHIVASGTLEELMRHPDSITGRSLREQKSRTFPTRGERRPVIRKAGKKQRDSRMAEGDAGGELVLHHAAINNLKDLTVRFPLGRFVCVTGVSGSGKSTLIRECLLPALKEALKSERAAGTVSGGPVSNACAVGGFESIAAVYEVDQSPIGRTPRSTPATYVGFFDDIRALFAQVPEARLRGYGPGRFSFNSPQGRCPECEGAGVVKLEMNFLPPAFVRCETCNGLRFTRETLDIEYGGKNIAQVLDLSVEEALEFFARLPRIRRGIQALHDTGLDYLKLGQTSPTLSGGEAQRVKLVTHLLSGLRESRGGRAGSRASKTSNLFLLEEPTIGLHMSDVRRLVEVIQRLVDHGHTVVVIEHNLDLIAEADWVIDLGPEGGDEGGRIVTEGTPEQVAKDRHSHTGRFLRDYLGGA